jgi:hypothetical protein
VSSPTTPLNITVPLTLEGSVVRLEPIRREHAELFLEVAKGDVEDIFRWIPYSLKTPEDFQRLIEKRLTSKSEASRWCLRLSSEVRDA